MKQKVITARVTDDIYDAIALIASEEGVSLSAVAARMLAAGLSQADKKPDWAIALEQRVSQVEQRVSQGKVRVKGKRRR